jgi:hypothetical protein
MPAAGASDACSVAAEACRRWHVCTRKARPACRRMLAFSLLIHPAPVVGDVWRASTVGHVWCGVGRWALEAAFESKMHDMMRVARKVKAVDLFTVRCFPVVKALHALWACVSRRRSRCGAMVRL